MTVRGGIGAMLKSNCIKERCRFYDDVSECAIDCCMYGASVEDEERERGCFMNGYTLMAESYRKLMNEGKIEREVAEKEIRIYDFLATCDTDDICRMVDSSAFNDIIRAFLRMAVNNADISEKDKDKVLNQLRWIFDEKQAKEVLNG